MSKFLRIEMPDHSLWDVPVDVIARSRAAFYADEFGGDVERSLAEDTLPLFEADEYEIKDWAAGNMDWSDVEQHATKYADRDAMRAEDFQEGWVNGTKDVVEVTGAAER